MRKELLVLSFLAACGKNDGDGTAPKGALSEPQQNSSLRAAKSPAPPDAIDAGWDAASVPRNPTESRSWEELLVATKRLSTAWPILAKGERAAFYKEWALGAAVLVESLREEGDGEQLERMYQEGARPPAMKFLVEEGYAYSAEISPAWLLKEFPDLPTEEGEYLRWVQDANRSEWFAEGNLETRVPHMVTSYKKGVALLEKYPDSFRTPMVERELDGIFSDTSSLLSQNPLPYAAKTYKRHVQQAFVQMAKQKRHGAAAKLFIKKLPAAKLPYPYEVVDEVRELAGMLD